MKLHLHHSSQIKGHKGVTKQYGRKLGFSSFFCLLMEEAGSVQINYGSGSRSKKTRNTENNFLRGLKMLSLMTDISIVWILIGGKL